MIPQASSLHLADQFGRCDEVAYLPYAGTESRNPTSIANEFELPVPVYMLWLLDAYRPGEVGIPVCHTFTYRPHSPTAIVCIELYGM